MAVRVRGRQRQHKHDQTKTDIRRQLRCSGTCLSSNGRGYYISSAGDFEGNKLELTFYLNNQEY